MFLSEGEYNSEAFIRKQMTVSIPPELTIYSNWRKMPKSLNINLEEFQVYDVSPIVKKQLFKRRFLCSTNYFFFEDDNEDYIEKVQVTIKDNWGDICLNQLYNRIDRINRRFYTNQYVLLIIKFLKRSLKRLTVAMLLVETSRRLAKD